MPISRIEKRKAMRERLRQGQDVHPPLTRPRTRSECRDGPRPCPWVGCRHHTAIDVTKSGSIRFTPLPKSDVFTASCALDLAEVGGLSMREVAHVFGVTSECVRMIQNLALEKLAGELPEMENLFEDKT